MSETARNLRLEWVEAGTLTANPHNWRTHGAEQMSTIKDMLADPEVGWAGVLLFNERTGRLIDGHARKDAVDPQTLVPVLVGSWSEEGEAKILATLDPIAAMAGADRDAFAKLIDTFEADTLSVRDLIDRTLAGATTDGQDEDDNEADKDKGSIIPGMELRPFEHYDYVLVLARNTQDWERLVELCQLERVNASPIEGKSKIGLGRLIDAGRLLELIERRAAR